MRFLNEENKDLIMKEDELENVLQIVGGIMMQFTAGILEFYK